MKHLYTLLFVCLFSLPLVAQVSGVVLDDKGNPLTGVIVQSESGATATTDLDGFFEIDAPAGSSVQVALFGYKSQSAVAAQNMKVILQRKGAKKEYEKPTDWQLFLLANGATSFPFSPSVGVTVGMVRVGGWYANFMMGFGTHFKADARSDWGRLTNYGGSGYLPFYTGDYSRQFLQFTGGGVVRTGSLPMYVYAGMGYAYKSTTYKTNNDSWVAMLSDPASDLSPLHSITFEAGVMGNIHGFALSVGYELLMGVSKHDYDNAYPLSHVIKIGIGGIFTTKGRAKQ